MTKHTFKKVVGSVVAAGATLPTIAFGATDITGLNYATSIGLTSTDVRETIGRVINGFMGLLGIVAVVIILLGGFKWMTAGGSEEKVAEAKKLIISGIIGLIIIMSAFAIARFVVGTVINGTG